MAHFAQLDENNVVTQVVVVNNAELLNDAGQEEEIRGIYFLQSIYGQDTKWVQTSYNGTIRRYYAGIGSTYNADRDVFVHPAPFASWTLDNETLEWQPPVACPTDGKKYYWDEETQSWLEIPNFEF